MAVVSYPDGKPLNWDAIAKDPNRVTKMVQLDRRSKYGHAVRGSLFPIACLDAMDIKARAKYGRSITIIQTAFNSSVQASAGTHDYDYCMDWWIDGVSGPEQQRFARFECGWADWYRTPAQGFPTHQHGFPLPPDGHNFPTRVGKYIDGANGTTSSQIVDYWNDAWGLAGMHNQDSDPSPFPTAAQKKAGIFDLDRYILKQRESTMEYKDWSDESKREMAGDVAEALANRLLDVEGVDLKQSDGSTKKIPVRNAIQRAANK